MATERMNDKTMSMNLKNILKNKIIKKITAKRRYFSRAELLALLNAECFSVQPQTLTRYLVEFCGEGILYGAGRGWYSSMQQPFALNQQPVKKLSEIIRKKYPLLSFSLWSTEQVKSYAQHMLTKFVAFAYTDRDAMAGVYDFLRDSGYVVCLNPRGNDAQKFLVDEKTVVIRPVISRDPAGVNFAGIEKILVDIFVEASDLNLMDEEECFLILRNVLGAGRVDVGTLLNYARRRKLKTGELIERIESL